MFTPQSTRCVFRVLLDHNVPATLRHYLTAHEVRTAAEVGWAQISNGKLIQSAVAAGFDLLVTCDQNIKYQQNLSQRKISILVLGSNVWPSMLPYLTEIGKAVERASPNSYTFVDIAPVPKRRLI